MDGDELDFEENNFYLHLLEDHEQLVELCGEKHYVLCIPSVWASRATFSQEDIDAHSLKPSPFYKDQYISLHDESAYKIEDGFIAAVEGGERIKIVQHEICYNSQYLPYNIYMIERPLSNYNGQITEHDADSLGLSKIGFQFEQHLEFLMKHFSTHASALKQDIEQFVATHVFLKDYLAYSADRLRQLYDKHINSIPYVQLRTSFEQQLFCEVMDNIMMGLVHPQVWPKICTFYEEETHQYENIIEIYRNKRVTGKDVGLDLDIPLTILHECIQILSSVMDTTGIVPPLQQLYVLKAALDALSHSYVHYRSDVSGNTEAVSADVLLPLTVLAILYSNNLKWPGRLQYISLFRLANVHRPSLDYALTTFEAALSYLKRDPLNLNANRISASDTSEKLSLGGVHTNAGASITVKPRIVSTSSLQLNGLQKSGRPTGVDKESQQKQPLLKSPIIQPKPIFSAESRKKSKDDDDGFDFLKQLRKMEDGSSSKQFY